MEGRRRSNPALRKKRPVFGVKGGSRGNVRYTRGPGGRLLDPSCELEVLKCIMVREMYLSRVTRLVGDMARKAKRSHGRLQALPPGMVDLLDLLRMATLETVEAISLWRLSQVTPKPVPFEWNGDNYLMKMLQDCDFLDRFEALRSWLGFSVSGNPFLLPQQSCVGMTPDNSLGDRTNSAPNFRFDKNGLADVGSQPWLGPLKLGIVEESQALGTDKGAPSRKRKLRKAGGRSSLAPYDAAVVNDPTLLPAVKRSAPTELSNPDPFGLKSSSRVDAPPGTVVVGIEGLVPNLVSREDAQRIYVARQALLEEQMRVREAENTSQPADGGRDDRRRSRALSTVWDAASSSARKYPRASASSTCGSPTTRRISHFGLQSSRRNGSSVGTHSLDSRASSTSQGPGDMRSIVLTTAGLLDHPPAEPHPGLGPVLLQSGRPGGGLHPNPFLHTVSDLRSAQTEDLGLKVTIRTPNSADASTIDRCSTAPLATPCSLRGSRMESNTQNHARRPSANHPRAVTAPAKMPGASSIRSPSFTGQGALNLHAPGQEKGASSIRSTSFTGQETQNLHAPGQEKPASRISCLRAALSSKGDERGRADSGYSPRGQGMAQKSGAELRALTAAGTAGRRQPPPREARLRRLARDVARHSAEVQRLVREEQLRKSLACCGGGDEKPGGGEFRCELRERDRGEDAVTRMVARRRHDGGARAVGFSDEKVTFRGCLAKRMEALLGDKRREIELKTFDLGVKRNELRCLRMAQKQERKRKLAMEMERSRAHLNDGQRLPEDEKVAETLEDSSCLLLQKRFRGNVGRAYAAWYKGSIQQAATTVQRGVRFIWDRRATRRRLLLNASVRPMQAAIRMFVKRQQYKRLLSQRKEFIATCKLQGVSRGMLGRRRAAARRSMIAAATRALDWVSLERLQPGHLKGLARVIHGALVDPVRQFPPVGVLGALRVALTILDDASETTNNEGADAIGLGCGSSNGKDMVTFETALGRTIRSAVSPSNLTWEMAARVLERPFRLLRRMRAFASGLGASSDSTPARLLHLSPEAAKLLSAYRNDPSWSPEALSAVTEGGVAAKAFVGWATELERVYREQPCVEAFLRDAQPAWLRKGRSFQRRRRALELQAEACREAVSIARKHRRHLETQGLAYGDPVMATGVLQNQLDEAEEAVRQLECRRGAFLTAQAKVEEDAGSALKEDVEFAEREASVAAREQEMALRLGQSGPEGLEALAGKVRDCGVVVRELQRRLRVWEQRCQEEQRPLLDEWVPPTDGQARMSRVLGEARAWREIIVARKARLIEAAGGRRFIKGLSCKDLEAWRSTMESQAACGADIEAGEARLAEDEDRFERELSRVNAEIAAEKVRSAPWDNATEDTQLLERQEDADAARDERRTAMGATLPPGMLGNLSQGSAEGGQPSHGGTSRRPTLLLLGLDLPASVRDGLRAGLDREAPGLFGGHVVGADALPSAASAAQAEAGRRGLFERCREIAMQTATPPISSNDEAWLASRGGKGNEPMPEVATTPGRGEKGRKRGTKGVSDQVSAAVRTRASLVQAALSQGKNVSLEVAPGPGLWARGRFLRDLEVLLGGLHDDDCDGGERDTSTRGRARKRSGPTVLLVDGHNRNRSGGGIDLSYGTKIMGRAAPQEGSVKNPSKPDLPRRPLHEPECALPVASLAARRTKSLMEEAAQCLHDLCTTYGKTSSPFKAIRSAENASPTPHNSPEGVGEPETGLEKAEARGTSKRTAVKDTATERDQPNISSAAEGSPGMDLLLAACHMILHPDRWYDVGEGKVGSTRTESAAKNVPERYAAEMDSDMETENAATLAYVSCLAGTCRKELAEKQSAQDVAETLRGADLDAIPLETAVALRRFVRHPDWPAASPRPDMTECCASAAFVGWISAAVASATELALDGGGGPLEVCSGWGSVRRNGEAMGCCTEDRELCGGVLGTRSAVNGGETDSLLSLKDVRGERQREQEVLREMEAALIDENVTVLDDDSPWLLQPEPTDGVGDVQDRRQCRTSEVLNALMETALRPFNVFEEPDCRIPASSPQPNQTVFSSQPEPQPMEEDRCCVTVSRAFGSVYARAASLGTGRMRKGQTIMTRTREEELIPLLSSNWMEKHDLSALRELQSEPSVWRALIDTLVLHYPDDTAPGPTDYNHVPYEVNSALAVANSAAVTLQDDLAVPDASPSMHDACRNRSSNGKCSGVAVLSFRHERRLTLETSCLLMGRAVPVSVFEESRSDFWCEAEVPAALTSAGNAACPVGLRIPKECIPLILDDGHPMRMRAILDASDLRHLSVLIADRLKLCRVGLPRKGPSCYHYWLDGAMGGKVRPENSEASAGAGATGAGFADAKQRDEDESGREFRLSLRKRSIGQVVFSRLVSFWVPSSAMPEINKSGRSPSSPHVVQKLVIVKEFSHRGECGELRGEIHDPDSGGGMDSFVPTPELTRMLLNDWLAEMKAANGRNKNPCAHYWRDALTWRLRIGPKPALGCDGIDEGKVDETESFSGMKRTAGLTLDERKPLSTLRRVAAASRAEGGGKDGPRPASNMYFDVMLLLRRPEPASSRASARRRAPAIDLVATHRQTMTAFNFSVSVASLVKELDGMVAACLTAPTALSTELELSASNTILRGLAAKWLQYSPGNAPSGRGPSLTLNLPRTKPIVAEPYVSLRYSGGKEAVYRTGHAEAQDAAIAMEVGPAIPAEGCAPDRRRRTRGARGSMPGSKPRGIRKSIATLQVETRNERMVFRRSLPVPRLGGLINPGREEGGVKELGPKALAVSVYEAFTVGSSRRTERHLRFCVRDETVRPVVEAAKTIAWVGTCEGIEGGRLWRVVTQGLSVGCERDKAGKCVRMRLKVVKEAEAEAEEKRVVSRHAAEPSQPESLPPTTLLSLEGESKEGRSTTREPKAASGECNGAGDNSKPTAIVTIRNSEERTERKHSAVNREQTSSGRAVDRIGDIDAAHHLRDDAKVADAIVAAQEQQECLVSPVDDVYRQTPDPPKGRGETWLASHGGGASTEQVTRVYTGWHRVTGIRLHVQCFQVSNGSAGDDLADFGTRVMPAGRGGAIGLPCHASLHFLVCDPSTGHRTKVSVPVEDLRGNLSVEGGIVEAGLLDAGRRPALAKAIAEKLRLVFEASGGYRVVFPLPVKTTRPC